MDKPNEQKTIILDTDYEDTMMPCLQETVIQSLEFISYIFMMSTLFLFITRQFFGKNEKCHHWTSIATGLVLIFLTHFMNLDFDYIYVFYGCCLLFLPYILLKMYIPIGKRGCILPIGILLSAHFIAVLINGEFCSKDHYVWLKFRGLVMVAMMKIISIAFEHENGNQIPTCLEYCGYMLCPGNVILGPWTNFKEYYLLFHQKKAINKDWIVAIVSSYFISVAYICGSNCIFSYFITDDLNHILVMYREAIMFRMSHYFISSISEASMMSAGFTDMRDGWRYQVTYPSEIECPRSLTTVVMFWNIPTHTFLKRYVFSVFVRFGKFFALLTTFIGSAMLHGLSVEVTIVLLHLGLFAYVHNRFQNACATFFNACVLARRCRKNCSHTYKGKHIFSRFLNFNFAVMTIYYLLYIGCLMDGMSYDEPTDVLTIFAKCLKQWTRVGLSGHALMVSSLLMTWILEISVYIKTQFKY